MKSALLPEKALGQRNVGYWEARGEVFEVFHAAGVLDLDLVILKIFSVGISLALTN